MEAVVYIDGRGWTYKVLSGIGANAFKARYFKPDTKTGCPHGAGKGVTRLLWRPTFEEAQCDLDDLATKKGWRRTI